MFKFKIAACLVLMLLVFSWFVHACFAVDRAVAEEALVDAESSLASAYVAVAGAEEAGANVSELIVKLEAAGNLLAEANNSYMLGDYDEAYSYAVNCSDTVEGLASEASGLKLNAERAYGEGLRLTAALSSGGLIVLFVLSLYFWKFLKERYFKRVLKMKPEVGKAE